MNYKEVINHIENIDPDSKFLAVTYNEFDNHFYLYLLTIDDGREGVYTYCQLGGGVLFEGGGIEGYLTINEVISDISTLQFKPFDETLDIMDIAIEYMLFKLFPKLPDPSMMNSDSDELNFFNMAKHYAQIMSK